KIRCLENCQIKYPESPKAEVMQLSMQCSQPVTQRAEKPRQEAAHDALCRVQHKNKRCNKRQTREGAYPIESIILQTPTSAPSSRTSTATGNRWLPGSISRNPISSSTPVTSQSTVRTWKPTFCSAVPA